MVSEFNQILSLPLSTRTITGSFRFFDCNIHRKSSMETPNSPNVSRIVTIVITMMYFDSHGLFVLCRFGLMVVGVENLNFVSVVNSTSFVVPVDSVVELDL